jgi:hypothetical protein
MRMDFASICASGNCSNVMTKCVILCVCVCVSVISGSRDLFMRGPNMRRRGGVGVGSRSEASTGRVCVCVCVCVCDTTHAYSGSYL